MSGLSADLHAYRLPLVTPLITAHGTQSERVGVLLSITDGHHTGWGEAAPMPGWSRETLADVGDSLAAAVAGLGAVDGTDDPRIAAMLDELERQPHARAAVAGAVLDLTARQQGLSVALVLSDDAVSSVAVNGLVADAEPQLVAAAVRGCVDRGCAAVKIKVAALDPSADLARVAAARQAAGPDVELRVDANGGWDVDTAVATLLAMSEFDIAFCEEPTVGIDAIAAVGALSAVPVAVDESARTVDDIAEALGTRAIDVVVVKPQALGGADLGLRAIRLAQELGASAVVTTMIDSAVGVAHAAHLAAASGSSLAHGLDTSPRLGSDVGSPLEVIDGRLRLPAGPGLGVVPDIAR